MNSFLQDLMKDTISKGLSDKIGSSLGVSSSQADNVISMLMPTVLGGLQSNAEDEGEAEKITSTIAKHHAGGGIFNHLDDLVANPEKNKGDNILSHILGGKRNVIEKNVAQQSGMNSDMVSKIFTMVAPLVMGEIGKKITGSNSSSSSSSLLSGILGSGEKNVASKEQSLLTSLLDKDGDGEIMDDVLNIGMNFLTKKG